MQGQQTDKSFSSTVVQVLKEIQTRDPEAFAELVSWRQTVNANVVSFPALNTRASRGKNQIGIVSLLNAILSTAGQPRIVTVMDEDTVIGFEVKAASIPDLKIAAAS